MGGGKILWFKIEQPSELCRKNQHKESLEINIDSTEIKVLNLVISSNHPMYLQG